MPTAQLGRVSRRHSFAALRDTTLRVRRGPIAIAWVPSADDGARVAFAVGRAVGPAVVRNRVRRRLRAALASASLPPGDYLVHARPAAVDLPASELVALVGAVRDALADRAPAPPPPEPVT